jgi:hypothetical protein
VSEGEAAPQRPRHAQSKAERKRFKNAVAGNAAIVMVEAALFVFSGALEQPSSSEHTQRSNTMT